jgi:hypothetical protein
MALSVTGSNVDHGTMSDVTLDRNGLEVLDAQQCMELLDTVKVGRVGVTTEAMPVVLPVTFALDGSSIVFCSTPGTKLYLALAGAVVAFEADDVDPELRFGWSVCIVGPARVLGTPDDIERVRGLGLYPWADLDDPAYISVAADLVTGRRVRRGMRAAG